MMVIYLPVKFEFDWSNRFRVRKGQTNGWNFTNIERNLAMMLIYVPVKFEFDWTNRFRVRVWKRKMWTDRWTNGRRTHQSNRRFRYTQPA